MSFFLFFINVKDNIPAELENLIMSSHFDFVKEIMNISIVDIEKTLEEPPGKKKKTVLTKFKVITHGLFFLVYLIYKVYFNINICKFVHMKKVFWVLLEFR